MIIEIFKATTEYLGQSDNKFVVAGWRMLNKYMLNRPCKNLARFSLDIIVRAPVD